MQNALPEGVPWGPVSGATLSLGWRLQMRGLAHSSLQASPGVADCSSPRQSESAASTPTHCSVSPSESGAPLSSCTVRQPASRAGGFPAAPSSGTCPHQLDAGHRVGSEEPRACFSRALRFARGWRPPLLSSAPPGVLVGFLPAALPRVRLWGCVQYRWSPRGLAGGGCLSRGPAAPPCLGCAVGCSPQAGPVPAVTGLA